MSKPTFALISLCLILSGCDFLDFGDSNEGEYKIAFLSRRIPGSAEWQIFLMDSDGGRQEKLFEKTLDYAHPVPSPGRSQIAVTVRNADYGDVPRFDYELYVIELADRSTHLLASTTQFCGQPTWSPAGDRLAFVMSRGAGVEDNSLYVTDVAGNDARKLTDHGDVWGPSWSPDGNSIAFASSRQGESTGIYLINPDGGGMKKIVDDGRVPQWSPSGSQIVFTSGRTGSAQIYTVNVDGTGLRQLTSSSTPSGYPGWGPLGNSSPAWSPDGEQIVYVSYPDGDPEIYVMGFDGSRKRRLTRSGSRNVNPSWSWKGRHILFVSNRNYVDRNAEVFIMKPDGSAQRPLSDYPGDDVLPVWVRVP